MDDEFLKAISNQHIPMGSTIPHPDDWKGDPSKTPHISKRPLAPVVEYIDKNGKKKKKRLSEMQVKMLHYLMKGYTKRQAMLKAGYSQWSAQSPGLVLKHPALKTALQNLQDKFSEAGLDTDYYIKKFKQWMEATKTVTSPTEPDHEVPDFPTQIKAFEVIEKFREKKDGPAKNGVTEKVTIERFFAPPGREDDLE